jgi:hypothetical protein
VLCAVYRLAAGLIASVSAIAIVKWRIIKGLLSEFAKPRIGEFLGKKPVFVIHANRLCFSV